LAGRRELPDIATPSGLGLTLVNPASIVRQMSAEYPELYGIVRHTTIRRPMRPGNIPDPWERRALAAFDRGETEVHESTDSGGEMSLRLMRPLMARDACRRRRSRRDVRKAGEDRHFLLQTPVRDSAAVGENTLTIVLK
jgi:hypothetical protein